MNVEIVLPARPQSVSVARRVLADDLQARGVDDETTFNALVVAGELVSNAIEHGSRPGDHIELSYAIGVRRIQIAVRDRARLHRAPTQLTSDSARASGRGLQIVDQLATWDEEIVDGRREVRAELTFTEQR